MLKSVTFRDGQTAAIHPNNGCDHAIRSRHYLILDRVRSSHNLAISHRRLFG